MLSFYYVLSTVVGAEDSEMNRIVLPSRKVWGRNGRYKTSTMKIFTGSFKVLCDHREEVQTPERKGTRKVFEFVLISERRIKR